MGAIYRPSPAAATITINFGTTFQTIAGFGASDRDEAIALTNPLADLFFSSTPGSGASLSILRSSMEPDGTYSSFIANVGKAASRGANIISAVWSAPGAFKSNGTTTNGGNLLVPDYNAWATTYAGFQATVFASQGVNLYGMEVQNEPDITASYDSMTYTNAQMAAFIEVLGPKVAALSPAPILSSPSVSNWDLISGYTAAIAADASAKPYIAAVSTHQYAGTVALDTNLPTLPMWETEVSGLSDTLDPTMTFALVMAGWMHTALTVANVTLWCYWMLNGNGTDNQGLTGQNSDYTFTKRIPVMGNFSAFVRPGFVRVGTSGSISGVSVSAYRNPSTKDFVVVAINTNATTQTCNLAMTGGLLPVSATPWTTSASYNLRAGASIPAFASVIAASLDPLSVTSFVGAAT